MILAVTDHYQSLRLDAATGQVGRHRLRAALRQRLIIRGTTGGISMPRDLDDRIPIFPECAADLIQNPVEVGAQISAVGVECDATRHIDCEIVPFAYYSDAGAGKLVAQLSLLAVLIVPHGATGNAAERRAYQGILQLIAMGEQADDGPARGPIARIATGLGVIKDFLA